MSSVNVANESFKQSYRAGLAIGLMVAVIGHVALFVLFPRVQANGMGTAVSELEALELPPEVTVPPAPEDISRPATPRVAASAIGENVTIAPTTFEDNPVHNLAPPPRMTRVPSRPTFIPYTEAPELQNRMEVLAFLQSAYPAFLRNAGIGGQVLLWLYIDDSGQVQQAVLAESSGYEDLDYAAKEVAERMEFSPAMNLDKKTAVWLAQSIDFDVS